MPRELESVLIIFDLNLLWVTFYAVVMTEVLSSCLILPICIFLRWIIGDKASATLQKYRVCAAAFKNRVSGHFFL